MQVAQPLRKCGESASKIASNIGSATLFDGVDVDFDADIDMDVDVDVDVEIDINSAMFKMSMDVKA